MEPSSCRSSAAPGLHGIALAHRDLDDGLVGLRDQLEPIALERAEDLPVVGIPAARGERHAARDSKEQHRSLMLGTP